MSVVSAPSDCKGKGATFAMLLVATDAQLRKRTSFIQGLKQPTLTLVLLQNFWK